MKDCKSVLEFEQVEQELQFAKEAHLRAKGWTHTSSTPGCYWMWRRKIGDVEYMVDTDTAWRIQGTEEAEERYAKEPPSSRPDPN